MQEQRGQHQAMDCGSLQGTMGSLTEQWGGSQGTSQGVIGRARWSHLQGTMVSFADEGWVIAGEI